MKEFGGERVYASHCHESYSVYLYRAPRVLLQLVALYLRLQL